jgi:aspartate/methionine/tyrosine aminotransferase
VPATIPEEERVCRLLERRDVLVHPGYFFDFDAEAYVVLSLLVAEETFAVGVQRLLADL